MPYDAPKFLADLFSRPKVSDGERGLDSLPPAWRDHYDERVAIMHNDGGLPWERAEEYALADTLAVMRRAATLTPPTE